MTNRTSVFRTTSALLAVGFVALLLIEVTTFRLGDRARATFDEAVAARDIRAAATEARAAVLAAETSQRGYLLTGNQIYLAPYSTAKTTAQRELDNVNRLLAGDEPSRASLTRLAEVVSEKLDEMDRTIVLKRDQKDAEALALVRSNRGKALMDQANVFFSGISRAADERLTRNVDEQTSNADALRWTTTASGVLIVAVVALVGVTVMRYTRELAAAREDVAALNRDLEGRVVERTADLARAIKELQHFTYVVSHDLRAPLVSIVGFTGEIEEGLRELRQTAASDASDATSGTERRAFLLGEELPEAIGFIRSSASRMDGLIAGILKLSREGRRVLRAEPIDIAELVAACADAIKHQLSADGGTLALDIAAPKLDADRSSMEQIVSNLLDNSVKYRSPDRPLRIDVSTRQLPGGRVELAVADTGIGIAERDRERVFDLFTRVGPKDKPGEGVGLAHIRAIVGNLGGTITLDSTPGIGTTFRVALPVSASGPARAPVDFAAPGERA